DCRTAALVGPDGSIDWCCLPHFDSPAILCRLLDADKGGFFRVSPVGNAQASMAYLPGTNILETVFESSSGRLQLLDYMPIRQRNKDIATHAKTDENHLSAGYERDLGNDVAAAHRLQRMVTCLEGSVELEVVLKATFDYARQLPSIERQSANANSAGAILTAGKRFLVLVVRREGTVPEETDQPPLALGGDEHIIQANIALAQGQRLVAMLNYARTMSEARRLLDQLVQQDVDADLAETLRYWRDWSAKCRYSGPHRDIVVRSALALKICIFEPTGAIVAAPTTSLPEGIGGVRNWDYRYTWLRDSAFTLEALGRLGYHDEARDYFHFLHDLHVKHGADLHIMYTIRGEWGDVMAEQELDYLDGYRGSRPVRIGNG
ncbi:MAG TPA: glycoside hydrolase family 15 protein, partial [Ktedonobacterales bacterium]|nr:glycoside hydrolase family 15 protein [Ktedonobacterales bacterium]